MTSNPQSSVTWFVFFSVASCCPKQTYFYQVLHRCLQETKGKRQFSLWTKPNSLSHKILHPGSPVDNILWNLLYPQLSSSYLYLPPPHPHSPTLLFFPLSLCCCFCCNNCICLLNHVEVFLYCLEHREY